MILFSQRHSPFARKAEVALLEASIFAVQVRHLSPNPPTSGEPEYEQNPLNVAPLLILDDGRPVYDSEEICFFIDEFSGGRLLPKQKEPREDALTRQTMATALCETGKELLWEIEQNEMGISVPGLREDLTAQLAAAYDILETAPTPDEVSLDEVADIGIIALATALDWLTFRGLDTTVPPHPNLLWWLDSFRERPSMTATVYEDLSMY